MSDLQLRVGNDLMRARTCPPLTPAELQALAIASKTATNLRAIDADAAKSISRDMSNVAISAMQSLGSKCFDAWSVHETPTGTYRSSISYRAR